MPVLDGWEATSRIRAHEKVRGLRPTFITALTAYASEDVKAECLKAGMDWYCTKPVAIAAIEEVLVKCREHKETQAAEAARALRAGGDFLWQLKRASADGCADTPQAAAGPGRGKFPLAPAAFSAVGPSAFAVAMRALPGAATAAPGAPWPHQKGGAAKSAPPTPTPAPQSPPMAPPPDPEASLSGAAAQSQHADGSGHPPPSLQLFEEMAPPPPPPEPPAPEAEASVFEPPDAEAPHGLSAAAVAIFLEDRSHGPGGDDLRVLVAEDNPVNQNVLKMLLKKCGICSPALVDDGEKAVEAYRARPYDCVFMDVQMPVATGLEATARIREHEQERGLPGCFISACTAFASDEDKAECLKSGMDDFVSKPVAVTAVKRVLECCRKVKAGIAAAEARDDASVAPVPADTTAC